MLKIQQKYISIRRDRDGWWLYEAPLRSIYRSISVQSEPSEMSIDELIAHVSTLGLDLVLSQNDYETLEDYAEVALDTHRGQVPRSSIVTALNSQALLQAAPSLSVSHLPEEAFTQAAENLHRLDPAKMHSYIDVFLELLERGEGDSDRIQAFSEALLRKMEARDEPIMTDIALNIAPLYEFLTIDEIETLFEVNAVLAERIAANKVSGSIEVFHGRHRLDAYKRLRSLTISVVHWWVPLDLPPTLTSLTITNSILLYDEILSLPRTLLSLSLAQRLEESIREPEEELDLSVLLPPSLTSLKAEIVSGINLHLLPLHTLSTTMGRTPIPNTVTELTTYYSVVEHLPPELVHLHSFFGIDTAVIEALPSSLTSLDLGFPEDDTGMDGGYFISALDMNQWNMLSRLKLKILKLAVRGEPQQVIRVPPSLTKLHISTEATLDFTGSQLTSLLVRRGDDMDIEVFKLPRSLTVLNITESKAIIRDAGDWPPHLTSLSMGRVSQPILPPRLTSLSMRLGTYQSSFVRELPAGLMRLRLQIVGKFNVDAADLPRSLTYLDLSNEEEIRGRQRLSNTEALPEKLQVLIVEVLDDEYPVLPASLTKLHLGHESGSLPSGSFPEGLLDYYGNVDLDEPLPQLRELSITAFFRDGQADIAQELDLDVWKRLPQSLVEFNYGGVTTGTVRELSQVPEIVPPLLLRGPDEDQSNAIDLQKTIRKAQSWRYQK